MKTHIALLIRFKYLVILYCLGLLALGLPAGAATSVERVSRSSLFPQRLVQVGDQPSSEAEAELVWQLMDVLGRSDFQVGLTELEQYLQARPTSPWAPSLDAALGKHYYDTGRYTLALEHWELAWAVTQDYRSGNGKHVADYTLAHWTRLLASLGRYESLAVIFQANRERVLDRGPLSQMWARTREAFVAMRKYPGMSYQCGTFALNYVAREMRLDFDKRALLGVPSPTNGFSVKALADLSSQLRLGLVAVVRTGESELVVPSVVHWRQNHYAAIVARYGNYYKVVDPTFGRPRYLTAETINAEASGYFIVPLGMFSANYRLATTDEMETVFGRGNPNYFGDEDDQSCVPCEQGECPPGSDGPGGHASGSSAGGNQQKASSCNSGCSGMAVWRVSEPYLNLWLEDEPLGYQPALGPRLSFTVKFKQRGEDDVSKFYQNFSSVGLSWNCSWLSCIYDKFSLYQADVYYAGGGLGIFSFGYSGTNFVAGNYYNNLKLAVSTNGLGRAGSYELLYPDGAKDVYGFGPTNYAGTVYLFYLSQKVSPEGYITSFQYEDHDPYEMSIRLKYVIDPDGRTNTLHYATGGLSNLITQVTDPFGRSTSLSYDTNGLLTNITDVASLNSAMGYDENGWVTNLTTAYGTTTFVPADAGLYGPDAWDRSLTITEPNNSKQAYVFVQDPPLFECESRPYAAADVPTNTPIGTLDNDVCEGTSVSGRYSYHWGRLQYAALSTNDLSNLTTNDYLKGRMRHWLGATAHGEAKKMDTLSIERAPSPDGIIHGQKTWYDYPNKGTYGSADQGDHIMPGVIARVLPDGSTWYRWMRRNQWGSPTNVVETYTKSDGSIGLRTNTTIYAANGLDLVQQLGPNNEQVVSNYFGNSYHQPDASYDGLNQETRYTYNASRQLTCVKTPGGLTTTNLYFASGSSIGRLERTIDLEIKGTNAYTYANGLVYSHTDERGLTVTNYWDNLQRLTATKYPDGTTVSNFYTALDLTATKDRLGYWSYAGFNGIRQKVAETNANNVITRYGYCECGALLSVTNAWNTSAQLVTSFGYDYQGNRLYTYYPDATVTNWFDSLQRVIATGDAWATKWFGYNNQGLLVGITNAFGPEQLTTYDIEDRPIYVTDANNVTVTNTYDDLGRLRTRTAPDGGAEAFGYSARGLTAYTNQLGFITSYAYDEAARKTCETNANAEVIRYTNSAAGDLLALVDGKSQVTKWNYDEYGRVTNKLDQAAVEILRYTYDPDSRLTNRWSKAKGDTKYSYDPVGNLTNVDYAVSTDIKYEYDALNRLTKMVDASGTNVYSYAAGGQLYTEDGPWASDTVTNTYNNRMRTGLDLAQPTGKWTNSFGYDAAKRLTSVTSPAGTFSYNLGAASAASPLPKKLLLPNTSYITNTYDTMGRLTGTYLKTSANVVTNKHEYTYNTGHQRTQQTFMDAATYGYTYDRIGQLTNADSSVAAQDRKYVYDAAWNLSYRTNNTTAHVFKVDGKNQVTNDWESYTATYDGNGNLTNRTSGIGGYDFTYDDENQLTAVQRPASWRIEFVYDGQGRLRKRLDYTWSGSWTLSATATFVYDGRRVIQERNGSNTPTVSYTRGTDLSGSLEGAGGIGGLVGRSHGYSAGNWSTHNVYFADGNGNVTYMLNASQTKVAEYRYDPFGETISSSGSLASANLYRFSSKMYVVDGVLGNPGLYYYGYRFYYPSWQRWPNKDPIGELGAINLYGFVHNNPINSVDLLGLSALGDAWEALKWLYKGPCAVGVGAIASTIYFKNPAQTRHAHCMVSCRIAKMCGDEAARVAGLSKEFYDLVTCAYQGLRTGKWDSMQCYSAFQPSDFKDNAQGVNCRIDKGCGEQCRDLEKAGETDPGPFYRKNK